METRKVAIRFKQSLSADEFSKLDYAFRQEALAGKKAYMDLFNSTWFIRRLLGKLGNVKTMQMQKRIEDLMAEKDVNGLVSSDFEQHFTLVQDPDNPRRYIRTFLGLTTIIGMPELVGVMKQHGIDLATSDKRNIKTVVKKAGLYEALYAIENI
jgi:hypothetical protein